MAAAVDWSGAKHHEARHLWIALWDPCYQTVVSVVPSSRADAVGYLCELAGRDDRLTVGLDFNFSFPSWWLDVCGLDEPFELWDDAPLLESWLADCPPPFWGQPGRRRPELAERQHYRRTELAAPVRPKSVFQIGGAGAVGTGSLRGMPALARLRRAGFAVWPFDTVRPLDGLGLASRPRAVGPVLAEVWPRLAAPDVIKRRPQARHQWLSARHDLLGPGVAALAATSDDAFDAVAAVIALAAAGRDNLLPIGDPLVRREGWIAGVPYGPPTPAA